MKIENLVESTRWVVVMDQGVEVFRAPNSGHTKVARKKCERFIEGSRMGIEYYRASAKRTDEIGAWLETQRTAGPRKVAEPEGYRYRGREVPRYDVRNY